VTFVQGARQKEGMRGPGTNPRHEELLVDGHVALTAPGLEALLRLQDERLPKLQVSGDPSRTVVTAVLRKNTIHDVSAKNVDGALLLLLNNLYLNEALIAVVLSSHHTSGRPRSE
jgi:hypothetical protein